MPLLLVESDSHHLAFGEAYRPFFEMAFWRGRRGSSSTESSEKNPL